MTAPLDEIVAACEEFRRTKIDYDEAVNRRNRAIWALADEGIPVTQMPAKIHQALEGRFTEEEIKSFGVSYGNVRLVLVRPRPPDPEE